MSDRFKIEVRRPRPGEWFTPGEDDIDRLFTRWVVDFSDNYDTIKIGRFTKRGAISAARRRQRAILRAEEPPEVVGGVS